MATDSKREQIIQYWVDKFQAGATIQTRRFKAVRRLLPSFDEFADFSSQNLPMLAIVAKLPKPVKHNRGREPGGRDVFISSLDVDFVAYALDNENPDSLISDLADDLWATLYGDTTSGSGSSALTLGLDVMPEPVIGRWDPYIIFKMICTFSYYHTTGGI